MDELTTNAGKKLKLAFAVLLGLFVVLEAGCAWDRAQKPIVDTGPAPNRIANLISTKTQFAQILSRNKRREND